MIDRKNVENRQ